jgi:hypothetical protein
MTDILPPPPLPSSGTIDGSGETSVLSTPREGRDARGRFTVGNSGKPKGARSRLITELEQAMEAAAPEIVRILIARAQCGDGSMEAARYVLERICPSRRGRLVEIEGFPEICTPADVPAALARLASAVGEGTITIEEGTAVGGLLQRFLDTFESARRLSGSLTTESPQLAFPSPREDFGTAAASRKYGGIGGLTSPSLDY